MYKPDHEFQYELFHQPYSVREIQILKILLCNSCN